MTRANETRQQVFISISRFCISFLRFLIFRITLDAHNCGRCVIGRQSHQAPIATAKTRSSCFPMRAEYVALPVSDSLRRKSFSSSFIASASDNAAANFNSPVLSSASRLEIRIDFATCQRLLRCGVT